MHLSLDLLKHRSYLIKAIHIEIREHKKVLAPSAVLISLLLLQKWQHERLKQSGFKNGLFIAVFGLKNLEGASIKKEQISQVAQRLQRPVILSLAARY